MQILKNTREKMRYFTINHTCCGVVGCNSGVAGCVSGIAVCNCGIAGSNDDIVDRNDISVDRCRDIASCGIISFGNILDCCVIICSIGCIIGRCGIIGCSGIIGCCDLTSSCGMNGCCGIAAFCEFAWQAIPLLWRYIWFWLYLTMHMTHKSRSQLPSQSFNSDSLMRHHSHRLMATAD